MGGRYGVFEVVGYGVYGEGAGFLEEFGGGGGDVEEGAAEDGGRFGGHFVSIRLYKHSENRGHYSMFKIGRAHV